MVYKPFVVPTLIGSYFILMVSLAVSLIFYHVYGGELSGWVQAIGSILAIVSGFVVAYLQWNVQRQADEEERAALVRAAYQLGYEALKRVRERLDTILSPSTETQNNLRGERTSEMILAMREFDISRLPSSIIPQYVNLRSGIHAMNSRISDVYRSENSSQAKPRERSERPSRLESAVRVHDEVIAIFKVLEEKASSYGADVQTLPLCENIDSAQR